MTARCTHSGPFRVGYVTQDLIWDSWPSFLYANYHESMQIPTCTPWIPNTSLTVLCTLTHRFINSCGELDQRQRSVGAPTDQGQS
jgi:hypothetical protein